MKTIAVILCALFAVTYSTDLLEVVQMEVQGIIYSYNSNLGKRSVSETEEASHLEKRHLHDCDRYDPRSSCFQNQMATSECYLRCDSRFNMIVVNIEKETDTYCALWCSCYCDNSNCPTVNPTPQPPNCPTLPPAPTMTTI